LELISGKIIKIKAFPRGEYSGLGVTWWFILWILNTSKQKTVSKDTKQSRDETKRLLTRG